MTFDKLKNILLRNSGAITLGLGIANLLVWIASGDSFILFLGIVMSGLGFLELASEFEKDASK